MSENEEFHDRRDHRRKATPDDCPMIGLTEKDVVANGIELGLRRVIEDEDLMKQFGKALYTELSGHFQNGASQWVGKRILTWVATAVLLACVAWLVKSGALQA